MCYVSYSRSIRAAVFLFVLVFVRKYFVEFSPLRRGRYCFWLGGVRGGLQQQQQPHVLRLFLGRRDVHVFWGGVVVVGPRRETVFFVAFSRAGLAPDPSDWMGRLMPLCRSGVIL